MRQNQRGQRAEVLRLDAAIEAGPDSAGVGRDWPDPK